MSKYDTPEQIAYRDNAIKQTNAETRSILKHLRAAWFNLVYTNNNPHGYNTDGRYDCKDMTDKQIVAELTCVDISNLRVEKNGKKFTIALIWGNSPGEAVADWAGPLDSEEGRDLEEALHQYSTERFAVDDFHKRADEGDHIRS